MSTTISTIQSNATKATNAPDVTVSIEDINSGEKIGMAKSISFNINKPKSPIYVLSQEGAAGFAKDPENRTFTLTEVQVFDQMQRLADIMNIGTTAIIIEIFDKSYAEKVNGGESYESVQIRLEGVEFESSAFNNSAGISQYELSYNGKFTKAYISGDNIDETTEF